MIGLLENKNSLIKIEYKGGKSVLVYDNKGQSIDIELLNDQNSNYLLTKADLENLLSSLRLTEEFLSSPDNGVFRLDFQNGTWTLIHDSDNLKIEFSSTTDNFSVQDLNSEFSEFIEQYRIYVEHFKYIEKNIGLFTKIENSTKREIFLSKDGDFSELFIPKGDSGTLYYRSYFYKILDNHSIDLSFKRYNVESSEICNAYDYYENSRFSIPKEALIELNFEDNSVVWTDLSDGTDFDNGFVIKDKCISSQKVIKSIGIYYENIKQS